MPVSSRVREARAEGDAAWSGFQTWVNAHSDSRWVFRGLGDRNFDLCPTVGRSASYDLARERGILEIFERRAAEFADARAYSLWDFLALAQHHGLPTRLLDWTTNPLIAAFFAVTNEPAPVDAKWGSTTRSGKVIPPMKDVDAQVVAWKVSSDEIIDTRLAQNDDPFRLPQIGFVLPRSLSGRIVSQSGLFSVHPAPKQPWIDPKAAGEHNFLIAGRFRRGFQRKLFYLGIDSQRTMGGLDGLCSRLKWQYMNNVGLGPVR